MTSSLCEGKCEEQGDTKLTGYKAEIGRTCERDSIWEM